MIIKKFYNSESIKIISHFFLILSFVFVFYFSFKTVLHNHSYSQIFVNYSEGFVKNALLGEVVFILKKFFDVDFKIIINLIFLIFHLLNIILFLRIIKPVINYNKFVYLFFVLNPALILFSIYDIGAFLRKEIFMITSFLYHIYISQLYNYNLIEKKKYSNLVVYVLGPFILINSLIHSIQILFFPVHFLIFSYNLNYKYGKKYLFLILILLILFFSQFFFYKIISIEALYNVTAERLGDFKNQFSLSYAPYKFLNLNISGRFYETLPYIKNLNFVILYLISAFLIFIPLVFIIKKIDTSEKKFNFFAILLSISPFFFLMFVASDWGRWIYIIAMIVIGVKLQFEIKGVSSFNYSNFIKFILLLFIVFYLFFYNLSHCCIKNLFFYGMNQNIQLLINILFENLKVIEHIKY